jgi:hypothetical protein
MSSTEAGRTWFRRAIAWTIAFVLYKPAAAIVYATAFRLVGTHVGPGGTPAAAPVADTTGGVTAPAVTAEQTSSGIVAVLTGLMLMLLALLALPALLRFLTPLVHATAGTPGRGAAMVAAALPTGAMALSSGNRATPFTMGRPSSSASYQRPDGASGGGGTAGGGLPGPRPGPAGGPSSAPTGAAAGGGGALPGPGGTGGAPTGNTAAAATGAATAAIAGPVGAAASEAFSSRRRPGESAPVDGTGS